MNAMCYKNTTFFTDEQGLLAIVKVPRLCDEESSPLWIQTPRPLGDVCFGLTGILESDMRYHNIAFCSLDEEETTRARWAKSKAESVWGQ